MYEDMDKDIIIEVYERRNVIKDCANFLKKMDKLNSFWIKFNEDDTMKSKVYFFNYIIRGKNFWPIIIITYDKYIFLANNKIQKV